MSAESGRPSALNPAGGFSVALALFALVFFARVWLIQLGGIPVPFWDQWDAEALALYQPWLAGKLSWTDLLAAHNEHRIVLTRLADLLLFCTTGGWNLWAQLLLNAALHATGAALLYFFSGAASFSQRPLRLTVLLGLALLFASPAGWQNALWGFQSQVYFGNIFALLALATFAAGEPCRLRLSLGGLCLVLGLLANGAGLLTIVAVLPAVVYGLAFATRSFKKQVAIGMMFAALLVLGWVMQTEVPQHTALHPQDAARFFAVLFRCLGWPWVDSPWAGLVMQLPVFWLIGRAIHQRTIPTGQDRFLISLAFWAMLHAAAIAWGRGGGLLDARPLSRYQDPLLLGTAANFLLLLSLTRRGQFPRIGTLLWGGLTLAGLLTLGTTVLSTNVPYRRLQNETGLTQIRAYLASGNAAALRNEDGFVSLHPNPDRVRQALDDPALRQFLPREFHDSAATPPWLVKNSPALTLLALGMLLFAGIWKKSIPVNDRTT